MVVLAPRLADVVVGDTLPLVAARIGHQSLDAAATVLIGGGAGSKLPAGVLHACGQLVPERLEVADVEKPRFRATTAIEVFSPEEVWALVRTAESEQDGAIFLTAAFTGLRRGELVALRWRDVDFVASRVRVTGSYAGGRLTTPKSGKVRSVPMAPAVASAARASRRPGAVGGC